MRRKRTADAPAETTDASTNEAPATLSADGDTIGITEETRENAPAADAVAETPKPRRPRTPRKKATEPESVAEVEAVEAVAPESAEVITELAPESTAVEAPAEKPKRAPRRRTTKAVADPEAPVVAETSPEISVVEETASEVVGEEPAVTAEPVVVTEAIPSPETEKPRPTRRRGTRKSAPVAEEVEEVTDAIPTPEVASDETETVTVETEVPAAETETTKPSRRTRGGRRRSASNKTTQTDTLSEEPVVAETVAETSESETTPTRRIRGLRRTSVGTTSVTPVEPLPPLYQPLPAEILARLAEARIVVEKNVAELVINGEPRLPLWFFVNTEDPDARAVAQREIRYAYEAGIRFFTVLSHLPWKTRSGERRYDLLDEILQFVADNAPDAFILPRLIFSPPVSWERANPSEMTRYSNGENGDVSLASRAFWEGEAEDALRAAVEHVAQSKQAGRVFGFYLEHGEWFHEKGRGYDLSEANTQGFRDWLKANYRNNAVALRASWHDGAVTFDTAEIPAQPAPTGPTLFWGEREQRYADFHEYSSDIMAQVITRLGKAVKEASGGRSAVAVSYGYTLELTRAASGHFALGQVLASPHIDILTGPVSYSARMPGGAAPLPAPIDSIQLAGKLWVSEDDTKTFLAQGETPDTYNPKIVSTEGTWAAHARNFGAALARGTGVSWMDLWGTGWLDDRNVWQGIGLLRDIAAEIAARRRSSDMHGLGPDVAIIVDERSFFDVRADESLLGHLVAQQRDVLLRSGARLGFYLLSDLAKENFPTSPRLLLFLNAFHIPDAVRTAIRDRWQNDGRTLAWLYGPGSREDTPSELTDVIGLQLRTQPWGSKMGTQIPSNARSPLTDALRGQKVGDEARVNPSFYVADTKAQALGEYASNSNTSLAVRKHARWQSVFLGETTLSLPLLRGLYKLAGVPIFTVDDDVAWVGDSLVCLHSAPGGGTTVYLPYEGVLYDILNDETLASDGFGARLSMPPRGTRLLFYGTATEVTQMGGDPKAAPPGLTETELLPAHTPFVFETVPVVVSPSFSAASLEDEALMEAALSGEFPLPDKDTDDVEAAYPVLPSNTAGESEAATATGEAASATEAAKKRRRRRRGRRKPSDDTTLDATDESTSEEESEIEESPAVAPPGPRGRLSLEELLPQSEAPVDGEIPPVPDEFLPLSDDALTANSESETSVSGSEASETGTTRRRRTRGSGTTTRRGRHLTEETPTEPVVEVEQKVTDAPAASAPSDENVDNA